jgi:hypothetical protein
VEVCLSRQGGVLPLRDYENIAPLIECVAVDVDRTQTAATSDFAIRSGRAALHGLSRSSTR